MLTDPRFSVAIDIFIPFHDCDPMGVVWHGNYFRYFEIAREHLLNQLQYGYRQMSDSEYIWPIVDVKVRYRRSIEFEQLITVHAKLMEYENRLKIGYQIVDKKSGEKLTTAYTIQVAVERATKELQFICPLVFLEKIKGKE